MIKEYNKNASQGNQAGIDNRVNVLIPKSTKPNHGNEMSKTTKMTEMAKTKHNTKTKKTLWLAYIAQYTTQLK